MHVFSFTFRYPLILLLSLCSVSPVYNVHAAPSTKLTIGGSGTDLATIRMVADAFTAHNPGVQIVIPPSYGSSGGVKALTKGKLDIALTSRALKPRELDQGVRATLYAATPLVFIVHENNAIDSITLNELYGYYTGEKKHWPTGAVVRPILRPKSDSDTKLILSIGPQMVSALETAYKRRGIVVAVTDQDSADRVSNIPGALGTSTLAILRTENHPLKPLTYNGVHPTTDAISEGRYPLFKELYFVLGNDTPALAIDFLRFLGSDNGAEILRQTGHQVMPFNVNKL